MQLQSQNIRAQMSMPPRSALRVMKWAQVRDRKPKQDLSLFSELVLSKSTKYYRIRRFKTDEEIFMQVCC